MEPPKNKYSRDFLEQAHKSSSCHKEEVLAGDLCGCFSCEQTYPPAEIVEWLDESNGKGETAFCPKCGIDAVLSAKLPITDKEFLSEMNALWF